VLGRLVHVVRERGGLRVRIYVSARLASRYSASGDRATRDLRSQAI
jgi:hypothetical protein